jgi:hypothetical protein
MSSVASACSMAAAMARSASFHRLLTPAAEAPAVAPAAAAETIRILQRSQSASGVAVRVSAASTASSAAGSARVSSWHAACRRSARARRARKSEWIGLRHSSA